MRRSRHATAEERGSERGTGTGGGEEGLECVQKGRAIERYTREWPLRIRGPRRDVTTEQGGKRKHQRRGEREREDERRSNEKEESASVHTEQRAACSLSLPSLTFMAAHEAWAEVHEATRTVETEHNAYACATHTETSRRMPISSPHVQAAQRTHVATSNAHASRCAQLKACAIA
eukprot:609909-Pleurochrysis_carterae.AAC.2